MSDFSILGAPALPARRHPREGQALARPEGSARLACGCLFDPRSVVKVQQGQESLTVLAERAQVPRLPDREDAPAGMRRQPSLSRLGGGEERPLHAQIGVDLLGGLADVFSFLFP